MDSGGFLCYHRIWYVAQYRGSTKFWPKLLAHIHVYFVHILAWSLFFGPIIILVPSLLIHEILIVAAHNFTFFFHGLLPGTCRTYNSSPWYSPNSFVTRRQLRGLTHLNVRHTWIALLFRWSVVSCFQQMDFGAPVINDVSPRRGRPGHHSVICYLGWLVKFLI
jgi:hypothetical protein